MPASEADRHSAREHNQRYAAARLLAAEAGVETLAALDAIEKAGATITLSGVAPGGWGGLVDLARQEAQRRAKTDKLLAELTGDKPSEPAPEITAAELFADRNRTHRVVRRLARQLGVEYAQAWHTLSEAAESAARKAGVSDDALTLAQLDAHAPFDVRTLDREAEATVITLAQSVGVGPSEGGRDDQGRLLLGDDVDRDALLLDPLALAHAYREAKDLGYGGTRDQFEPTWRMYTDLGLDYVGELRDQEHGRSVQRALDRAEDAADARARHEREDAIRLAEREAADAAERARRLARGA